MIEKTDKTGALRMHKEITRNEAVSCMRKIRNKKNEKNSPENLAVINKSSNFATSKAKRRRAVSEEQRL